MKMLVWTSAVIALAGGPSLVAAQELTKCVAGQEVTDKEGKTGVIVADDDKLCQVKYADGQIYSWIFLLTFGPPKHSVGHQIRA